MKLIILDTDPMKIKNDKITAKIYFFLAFFLLSFFSNFSISNSQQAININNFKAILIGKAELKFVGLKVYDISLWGERNKFSYQQKLAIQIRYNMNFSREELAKKSVEEIARLHNLSEMQKKEYYQKFLLIFTDVKKGDEKIAFFSPQNGVEMYFNQQKIGELTDLKISRLFIDIWLDERGSYPKVTKKLIGKNL